MKEHYHTKWKHVALILTEMSQNGNSILWMKSVKEVKFIICILRTEILWEM